MTSATKTNGKLKSMVRYFVEESLSEILGDPDEGLELKESIRRRLAKSFASKEKGIPAKIVARKLGLKW